MKLGLDQEQDGDKKFSNRRASGASASGFGIKGHGSSRTQQEFKGSTYMYSCEHNVYFINFVCCCIDFETTRAGMPGKSCCLFLESATIIRTVNLKLMYNKRFVALAQHQAKVLFF